MASELHYSNEAEGARRAVVFSLLGHTIFFLLILALNWWFQPPLLELGGGPGGGAGGDIITVGLSDALSGGAGMYKPGLTPRPEAVPPAQEERAAEEPPADAPQTFEIEDREAPSAATPEPEPPTTRPPSPARRVRPESAPEPGQIPGEAQPGSGGKATAGAGSGGGLGSGVGIQLGGGSGGAGLDSWYLRQVERRISENWLRSTLGNLAVPVQVSVTFEITSGGQIESVRVVEPSGIRSVDLSAERAVRASNPLPPLPPEFRRRRVRFVAKFEYPPR